MDKRRNEGVKVLIESGKKEGEGKKGLKTASTNIDGLLSKKIELTNYLQEGDPDIICTPEPELVQKLEFVLEKKSRYNIWRKNRKKGLGGGVTIMTKENLKVTEVRYENDSAEVMAVQELVKGGKKNTVSTVPLIIKSWK